jgi:hypothetical protein
LNAEDTVQKPGQNLGQETFGFRQPTPQPLYQVGIELPPGPVSPGVALVYQGGKGRGEAGQSWHLPVLDIYRMTDKGLPEFRESDRFAVTGGELNDELVQVNAAEHVYRLKNDDGKALFVRDSSSDTWTVRLPDASRTQAYVNPKAAHHEPTRPALGPPRSDLQACAPRVSPSSGKPHPCGDRSAAEFTACSPRSTVRRRRVHARIARWTSLRFVHVGRLGIHPHHPIVHPLVQTS